MPPMSETTTWPLTARVAPGYLLKAVLVAVLCLVFGVWGIYDYTIALPQQSINWHRAEVARGMNRIAEPILNGSTTTVDPDAMQFFTSAFRADIEVEDQPKLQTALEEQQGKTLSLDDLRRILVASAVADSQEAKEHGTTLAKMQTNAWLISINVMAQLAQAPVTLDGSPQAGLVEVRRIANEALQAWGDLQPPSKFDRQMQWLFILCLPFVPWYGWTAFKSSRRRYQLDEDGTLHLPEGTWPKDDIASVDMHRWMAKSKAWVEHVDGTRVLLDDFIYKGLWKIVGGLAATHHGDAWTEDAKPIKHDEPAKDSVKDHTQDSAKDSDVSPPPSDSSDKA